MSESKTKTCTTCKKEKKLLCFVGNRGQETKMCGSCRDISKKSREKNICEHNKRKSRCKECKGGSICEHNRDKYKCKECKGNGICEHNRRREYCKDCGGSAICEHKTIRSRWRE